MSSLGQTLARHLLTWKRRHHERLHRQRPQGPAPTPESPKD